MKKKAAVADDMNGREGGSGSLILEGTADLTPSPEMHADVRV